MQDASESLILRQKIKVFIRFNKVIVWQARTFVDIRRSQFELLQTMFEREQKRIYMKFVNEEDDGNFKFNHISLLVKMVPREVRDTVLREFEEKCKKTFFKQLAVWRAEVKQLRDQGLRNLNLGYSQYFCEQSRILYDFDEVGYDPKLCWQMDACAKKSWDLCLSYKNFRYYVKRQSKKRNTNANFLQKILRESPRKSLSKRGSSARRIFEMTQLKQEKAAEMEERILKYKEFMA